ncbi:MAG: tRNA uridine-5-carboxymethylaminomethyl(34) synthesis GTPase MnmE [Syntrophobacteraceae bacterium]|nr:tRNA uridine-5-carboxymethylaminomethyl(34) synthesis GTPase MnmE [Syntrophobacteraceae bacterium]
MMDLELLNDTICAIATPVGEAGIGLIRLSGPEALGIVRKIFRYKDPELPPRSHTLRYGWIVDPVSGELVDEVLLSYMSGPRTYTREDVVEINCHSGYAVLDRVLGLVMAAGARLAQPGEFTRRAFLSGRIDLSQAEAVIEMIRSRSEQGLLLANRHLRGDFKQLVEDWLEILAQAQSHLEALIDFSEDLADEAGQEPSLYESLLENVVERVARPLRTARNRFEEGRVLRDGLTFVLVGKPNVGKSSMLNGFLGKDRAIVTAAPGTTRDVIEDSFLLGGVQVRLLDTAGIRGEPDEIESRGIEMTIRSLSQADVALWLIDHSRPLSAEDHRVYEAIGDKRCVVILNKSDLPPAFTAQTVQERFPGLGPAISLSVKNPSDIDQLKGRLAEAFISKPVDNCGSQIVPNIRQKECLDRAMDSLLKAEELLRSNAYGELISFEIESARKQLEAILGRSHDVELLDRIFLQFCVGK